MTIQAQPAASTGPVRIVRRPGRRKPGLHEAAGRKARAAARKSPLGKSLIPLADAAVNLGREVDDWPEDIPGRASALREYAGTMKELTKYLTGTAEPSDDGYDRLKALVRDVPDE